MSAVPSSKPKSNPTCFSPANLCFAFVRSVARPPLGNSQRTSPFLRRHQSLPSQSSHRSRPRRLQCHRRSTPKFSIARRKPPPTQLLPCFPNSFPRRSCPNPGPSLLQLRSPCGNLRPHQHLHRFQPLPPAVNRIVGATFERGFASPLACAKIASTKKSSSATTCPKVVSVFAAANVMRKTPPSKSPCRTRPANRQSSPPRAFAASKNCPA